MMNRYEIRLNDGTTAHVTSDGFEPHPSAVYVFYTLAPDHTPKGAPVMVACYAIADVKSVRLSEPPPATVIDVTRLGESVVVGAGSWIDKERTGNGRAIRYEATNKDTPNIDRPVDIP
jgi:hypothetical protein